MNTQSHSKSGREERGASILLLSIVFMAILLLLGITLFNVIPAEMHAANRSNQDLNGHYVARSGIQETMSWLRFRVQQFEVIQDEQQLPDYTGNNGASYPNIETFTAAVAARRPFPDTDWRVEVEIIPQQDTSTTTNTFEARLYAVRSTAFLNDRPIQAIEVLLKQKTFASFAFYTESFDPSTPFIMNGESQISGPVHTNDFFSFDVSALNGATWDAGGYSPYFTDIVGHGRTDTTVAVGGDGNRYVGGAPYDSAGPIGNRYETGIVEGGRNDIRKKNDVDLPTSNDAAFSDTWTDAAPVPTDVGVFMSKDTSGRADGGIFINGDAEELAFTLDDNGNQVVKIQQRYDAGTTLQTGRTGWRNVVPAQWVTRTRCSRRGPPPTGGSGSGVGGGAVTGPCVEWEEYQSRVREPYDLPDRTVVDRDGKESLVYEVTEAPVTLTNEDGDPVLVQVGDTAILTRTYNDESGGDPAVDPSYTWKTQSVEVITGQGNGNYYVAGDVGRKDGSTSDRDFHQEWRWNRQPGAWGIIKGNAEFDSSGNPVEDSFGNQVYKNKAIITPNTNHVTIGGDLLQFDPEKFDAIGASTNLSELDPGTKVREWTKVARNPGEMVGGVRTPPELSPNNDHVLGILTRDVWMAGRKEINGNSNSRNSAKELSGGDGIYDVYAVILAGKTEVDGSGQPRIGANGRAITSGGVGTYRHLRNNSGDGLGEYNFVGGIIQGTVSNNYGRPNWDTHHWVDAGGLVGYQVKMTYDVEATRQRIFPVQKDFRIVRYFQTSARAR